MKLKINFLILASLLILVFPDMMYNKNQPLFYFLLIVFSKLCVVTFLASIILGLTKSFFTTYLIIGIAYIISCFVEIINLIILGGYANLETIKGLYFTFGSETSEFLYNFYIYFIYPIVIFALYLFFLIKYKKLKHNIPLPKKIIGTAIVSLLLSISISTFFIVNSPVFISGKKIPLVILRQNYLKQHPFNLYYRIYEFIYSRSKLTKFKKVKEKFSFQVNNVPNEERPKTVILIIGERIRYSNWSINGYHKQTSPNLKKISNLISFNKNYSNANATASSIPLIITQATPHNPDQAFAEKTIVSLYKEANYETIWISSQASCFDFIDNKNESNILYELYNRKDHTDLDILPQFEKVIKKNSKKNKLIVINMLGGHGKVPEQFNLFKPNSSKKNIPITLKNAPVFINDYDNMILFQEYILYNLIKMTEKQNISSFLLFTADHGCNLFDNGETLFGYGSAKPTAKETHVPLFIWTSNTYNIVNKNKVKNLNNHVDLLSTNDNIFYTLADLSNIKYKYFKPHESLANKFFIEPKSRFVYVNGAAMEFENN